MRLLAVLVAASLQPVLATPGHACSTSVFLSQILRDQIHLLAVPRGHTVEVPYVQPPPYAGPVRATGAESADRPLRGWTVRVEQIVGPAKDRIPSGTSEVVLVPWGYGTDCRPLPWQEDERWLEPGRQGVFSAYPRPRSQRVDGRPVLDVFLAWHQPYPTGAFLEHEARRASATDAPWLTVDEYWSLVRALPTAEEAGTAPERAGESLRRWAQAHPALVGRFPASVILARAHLLVK